MKKECIICKEKHGVKYEVDGFYTCNGCYFASNSNDNLLSWISYPSRYNLTIKEKGKHGK